MKTYKIFFLDHRSCYLNSLGDVLSQLGHRVFYQSSWMPEEIEAGLAYFQPDILLTVGCDIPLRSSFPDDLPQLCRKYGLFHIYWATEDKIHHQHWSVPFVQRIYPDLVWTIHPECVHSYERLGIAANALNFGLNPRLFLPRSRQQHVRYPLSFVGTTHLEQRTYRYTSFEHLLVPLVKHQQRVDIWGFGWKESAALLQQAFGISIPDDWLHGYLAYKRTPQIYHASHIVLGVQNAPDQVTQRTFEILGSGGCMLASRTEELSRLFIDGEEIILTDSPEETLELVQYYLARPQLCVKIGQKARRKVLKEHQLAHRLRRIWPQLESMLSTKGV